MNTDIRSLRVEVTAAFDDCNPALCFIDRCLDAGLDWDWINATLEHAITAGVRARIMATAADLIHNRTGPEWLPNGVRIGLDDGGFGLALPVELVQGDERPYVRLGGVFGPDRVVLGPPELQPAGFLFLADWVLAGEAPEAVVIGATHLLHLVAKLWPFHTFTSRPDTAA